jgi:hypothetical protein
MPHSVFSCCSHRATRQAIAALIAFAAWSSFAHAVLMAGQAFANLIARGELIGSAVLVAIGVTLIALAPVKSAK